MCPRNPKLKKKNIDNKHVVKTLRKYELHYVNKCKNPIYEKIIKDFMSPTCSHRLISFQAKMQEALGVSPHKHGAVPSRWSHPRTKHHAPAEMLESFPNLPGDKSQNLQRRLEMFMAWI